MKKKCEFKDLCKEAFKDDFKICKGKLWIGKCNWTIKVLPETEAMLKVKTEVKP